MSASGSPQILNLRHEVTDKDEGRYLGSAHLHGTWLMQPLLCSFRTCQWSEITRGEGEERPLAVILRRFLTKLQIEPITRSINPSWVYTQRSLTNITCVHQYMNGWRSCRGGMLGKATGMAPGPGVCIPVLALLPIAASCTCCPRMWQLLTTVVWVLPLPGGGLQWAPGSRLGHCPASVPGQWGVNQQILILLICFYYSNKINAYK